MKNKPVRNLIIPLLPVCILTAAVIVSCGKKEEAKVDPAGSSVKTGDFVQGKSIKVPLIAWGADLITINANGKSKRTTSGSLFHRAGLNIELFREDDFSKQTDMFIRGEIAFLRGTMGMINIASEKLNASTRTKPVLIFQHSWSAGGDALVVKSGIRSVKGLKGKSIAIQSYGPHVDYLFKLLKDAGLRKGDVKIIWTRDLVGPKGDTPMAKLSRGDIDAAFVIIPDALALTSNGSVGTGAEDSIKGARILLSTKTASRIISDVYAVRKDYFDSNRGLVEKFVRALLKSEEEVKDLFKNKNSDAYSELLKVGGKLLLDDPGAVADIKGMYYDAEMAGFNGNYKFFADQNYPRNYSNLSKEIQESLVSYGLISRRSTILAANWDYSGLREGLRYADVVAHSRFNPGKTSIVAEKLSKKGDSSLFMFEIFFKPNQNTFSVQSYRAEFDRVINLASTYGGALITVEGHSDPMSYLRKQKEGASPILLKKIKQSAKNLSYSRASSVRKEIVSYASTKNITLDPNQLTIIGRGISSPKFGVPKTRDQWMQNMRVQFKIMQVEAEEDVFKPLD
jgi:ABC-type nitrate/sulfonate/bicarbonate transport system substrate-binding protein